MSSPSTPLESFLVNNIEDTEEQPQAGFFTRLLHTLIYEEVDDDENDYTILSTDNSPTTTPKVNRISNTISPINTSRNNDNGSGENKALKISTINGGESGKKSQTSPGSAPTTQEIVDDNQEQQQIFPSSFSEFLWELVGVSSSPLELGGEDLASAAYGEQPLETLQTLKGPHQKEEEEGVDATPLEMLPPTPPPPSPSRPDVVLTNIPENPTMKPLIAQMIVPHLPPLLAEATSWNLIYSIQSHGVSINTLYRSCIETGPSLICIKDTRGYIFGGFASHELYLSTSFFGNGQSFLWKYDHVNNSVSVYHATGANEYFILCEPHMFSMGGGEGHFGLWFDEDLLHGNSEPCPTFGNTSLCIHNDGDLDAFEIVDMELYAFKY